MKKTIYFGVLFIASLLVFTPSKAQLWKKIKNEVKNRAENNIVNKAGNATDKTIDNTVDATKKIQSQTRLQIVMNRKIRPTIAARQK